MKKILIFLFLASNIFLKISHVYSNTIVLSPGESIQAAIDKAKNGDMITLREGKYIINQGLVIRNKQKLKIQSVGPVQIISTHYASPVISLHNSHLVILQECEFRYQNPGKAKAAGVIVFQNTIRCAVISCDISNGLNGIHAVNNKILALIQNNIHHNQKTGIYLSGSHGVLVQNNTVSDNGKGLEKINVTDLDLKNNDIRDNRSQ